MRNALAVIEQAAYHGFEWPDGLDGAINKMREELDELESARGEELFDEVGDVLFVAVTCAYYADINPPDALQHAVKKFRRRFRKVLSIVGEGATIDDMLDAWKVAKEND